jgi:hypothetical protein
MRVAIGTSAPFAERDRQRLSLAVVTGFAGSSRNKYINKINRLNVAGAGGIEPPNGGIKISLII